MQEETLAAKRRHLPPDHEFLPIAIANLAEYYLEKGRSTEAVDLYREALELRRRIYGPETVQACATMIDLAGALREAGDIDEARTLWEVLDRGA